MNDITKDQAHEMVVQIHNMYIKYEICTPVIYLYNGKVQVSGKDALFRNEKELKMSDVIIGTLDIKSICSAENTIEESTMMIWVLVNTHIQHIRDKEIAPDGTRKFVVVVADKTHYTSILRSVTARTENEAIQKVKACGYIFRGFYEK